MTRAMLVSALLNHQNNMGDGAKGGLLPSDRPAPYPLVTLFPFASLARRAVTKVALLALVGGVPSDNPLLTTPIADPCITHAMLEHGELG